MNAPERNPSNSGGRQVDSYSGMIDEPIVRDTGDGSHTLYSEAYGQHFHNPNGAIAESRHVFFEPLGLAERLRSGAPTTIFEVGFGTGLNLLLLLEESKKSESSGSTDFSSGSTFHFMSVEGHLASLQTLRTLNHAKLLGLQDEWSAFLAAREGLGPGWNEIPITPRVTLSLFLGRLEEISTLPRVPDAIFHDPFSPVANPECWSILAFEQLRSWSAPHTTLRTYGASSHARIAMASAGWFVAKAAGALGKREMTLAAVDPERLEGEGIIRMNEVHLRSRATELG